MQVDEGGTIYMQVDEEAMYSMRNNLHASG